MQCLGWKPLKSCGKAGRDQQVIPPGAACPDISWFYWGLAAALVMAFMGGKK